VKRRPFAFIGAVAGISLVTTYAVNVISQRWPASPLATFNSNIHKGTGSNG